MADFSPKHERGIEVYRLAEVLANEADIWSLMHSTGSITAIFMTRKKLKGPRLI